MTDTLYAILSKPGKIAERIDDLRVKQNSLRFSLLPAGINYAGIKVQTSPSDRTAAVIAEIDTIAGEIRQLEMQRDEAETNIVILASVLNNQKAKDLVVKRYCDCSSLGVIACDTGETIDCIKQRHSRAIKSLEKTICD